MLKTLKLAAYIDEAGEDPESACKLLNKLHIHYAVIRQAWTHNISNLSDRGCKKLKNILSENNISPIALVTKVGEVLATELINQNVNKVFDLAGYFNTQLVRVQIGTKIRQDANQFIEYWLNHVQQLAISRNIIPIFEITDESHYKSPSEIVTILNKFSRWKLLYDPAQLILKQNQDPFVKFWTLLKSNVAAIDVCDFKIGKGFKPVGFGDSKILLTMADAVNTNYKGWFFFEPCLGRRYGSYLTREDTFVMAYEALESNLQSKLGVKDD